MRGVRITANEATSPEERERDRLAWNLPHHPLTLAPAPASSEPESAFAPSRGDEHDPTKRFQAVESPRPVPMRAGRALRARIRRWLGLGRSGLRAPQLPTR